MTERLLNLLETSPNEDEDTDYFENWTKEDILLLLKIYLLITNYENDIYRIIYYHHDSCQYEYIFRNRYYNNYIKDKLIGIQIAIEAIDEKLNNNIDETIEQVTNELCNTIDIEPSFKKLITEEALWVSNELQDKNDSFWCNFTNTEIINLLQMYLIFVKREANIYDLIYSSHGCDSWEDIFRDYDTRLLKDKAFGIQITIDELRKTI